MTEIMQTISNRTFDELKIGDSASLTRTLTTKDIELFAVVSGDVNPAHLDADYAKNDMFHGIVAHGMLGGSLLSALLGTHLPGPGTIYLDQTFRFRRPVRIGDTVTATVVVSAMFQTTHRMILRCHVVNQHGQEVISGLAKVIAPTEKVSRPAVTLPKVELTEQR